MTTDVADRTAIPPPEQDDINPAPSSGEEDEPEQQSSPPAARPLPEIIADYEANKPLNRADVDALNQAVVQQRERLAAEEAEAKRIDDERAKQAKTLETLFPDTETALVQDIGTRFGLDDDQQTILRYEVNKKLSAAEKQARDAILQPIIDIQGGQLLQLMGDTAANRRTLQQTDANQYIRLAYEAAGKRLVDSGQYVSKAEAEKQANQAVEDFKKEEAAKNPERVSPRPGGNNTASSTARMTLQEIEAMPTSEWLAKPYEERQRILAEAHERSATARR